MLSYPDCSLRLKIRQASQFATRCRGNNAVAAHREIFADHVTMPLCPLGRVIRKLQHTAIWTPQTLTLNCANKSGTAQGLMQCPIKGDTPYFTAVQFFWMLRRALQLQRKGQKHFPPPFWKLLYLAAIAEGPDLRMAAKAVEKEPHPKKYQLKVGYLMPANNQFLASSPTTKYSIVPAKGERVVVNYILMQPEHIASYQHDLPPRSPFRSQPLPIPSASVDKERTRSL